MKRVARSTLLLCTAFATFFAAMLHGRVLCSANAGSHFAIEQPHRDTGCPSGHDEHPETEGEHRLPADCTDISADFSLAREVVPASTDVFHAPLVDLSPVALTFLATPPSRDNYLHASVEHPPGFGDLACLRTIVLLA